jgi:hypothetical protein
MNKAAACPLDSSTRHKPGQILDARFGRAAWLFTNHSPGGIVRARQRQRYGTASKQSNPSYPLVMP